jgi:Skp family chaperone for outer membrane proteins
MRRFGLLLLVLLPVSIPTTAGPDTEPGAPLRIATFDLGRVERECRRKTEGADRIEKTFATEKKAFELLDADLKRMAEDLQSSPYRKDSPEYREQVARFRAQEEQVRKTGVDLASRIQEAKSALLREIYADLEKAVTRIAEEDGYDLVFQVQKPNPELPAPELARQLNAIALFHAHPRFDITNRILEVVNAMYAGG